MAKKIKLSKREQNERIVHEYMKELGVTEIDPDELTKWAIDTGRMKDERGSFFRRAKKALIQTMRGERQVDPQGREVKKMIGLRIIGAVYQKSLWLELFSARPEKALRALAQQRRSIVAYCRKHKETRESYNDNNKYGATLPLFDYNINKDLEEGDMPTEYPDDRPDDAGGPKKPR